MILIYFFFTQSNISFTIVLPLLGLKDFFAESEKRKGYKNFTVSEIILPLHSLHFSYRRLPVSTQLSIQPILGIISARTNGDGVIRLTIRRRVGILCHKHLVMSDGFIFIGMGFHFKNVFYKEKQNLSRLTCYCSILNKLDFFAFCILHLRNVNKIKISMIIFGRKIKR
jgi:hypothetical protein